jgi:hypothetical protein
MHILITCPHCQEGGPAIVLPSVAGIVDGATMQTINQKIEVMVMPHLSFQVEQHVHFERLWISCKGGCKIVTLVLLSMFGTHIDLYACVFSSIKTLLPMTCVPSTP